METRTRLCVPQVSGERKRGRRELHDSGSPASAPRYQSVTRQHWTDLKGCGIDTGAARRGASPILSASRLP